MAILWVPFEKNGEVIWAIALIEAAEAFSLGAEVTKPVRRGRSINSGAFIHHFEEGGKEKWVLITSGKVSILVNGEEVLSGLKVLEDKDEIRFGGTDFRLYYSTERLAQVELYRGGEKTIFCPRCKQEILAGSPVVRCPQCGVFHHQSEEEICWIYSDHCSLCDQPTALAAGYRWTPEAL